MAMLLISPAFACTSVETKTTKANTTDASFDPNFFIAASSFGVTSVKAGDGTKMTAAPSTSPP